MLGRLTRIEFIAVLPGGFLVLTLIYVVADISMTKQVGSISPASRIYELMGDVGGQAGVLLFVLFGAYLCGSVLRVMPVKWVERLVPPFRSEFPSTKRIVEFRAQLEANKNSFIHDVNKLPVIPEKLPMEVFNHWKNLVCMNSSEGFRLYQSFEARTRFYAGMFWAGLIGVLGGIWLLLFIDMAENVWQVWLPSLVILIVFASQFRRVRAQESAVLFSVYTGLSQSSV